MTYNKVCLLFSIKKKGKPSTIPYKKCNNSVWTSAVHLVTKISERHRKC